MRAVRARSRDVARAVIARSRDGELERERADETSKSVAGLDPCILLRSSGRADRIPSEREMS